MNTRPVFGEERQSLWRAEGRSLSDKGWAPLVTNNQISNVWDELGNGLFTFYISGPKPWSYAYTGAAAPS